MGKIINKEINMEILNILILFLIVFYLSKLIDFGVELWQALPIKEEKSIPIYITKEIKCD